MHNVIVNTRQRPAEVNDIAESAPVLGSVTVNNTESAPVISRIVNTESAPVFSANVEGSQVDGHSETIGSTTDADTALTLVGRIKKILSLIGAGLPSALVGGKLDVNLGSWLGSLLPTVGQKTMTSSVPVVIASNQSALPVSATVVTPPSSTPVKVVAFSSVVLASPGDSLYTITNGKTLTIQQLQAGAQNGTDGSKVTLYEDPNGNLSVLNFIGVLYVNQSSDKLDLKDPFVGNGTRRILMRRHSFSASSREIFGRWDGYEE